MDANTYKSSNLRPLNVWSEATTPESVQMLLNSQFRLLMCLPNENL